MLFLRSLAFNLVFWLSVLIYGPLVALSFPVPPLPRYRFIRYWARFNLWWLKVTCGLAHKVEGKPPEVPVVALVKHQSAWETLAMQLILPFPVFVVKRELLWIPFFGWALAQTEPIAINRGSAQQALRQFLRLGEKRLREDRLVLIFPEGTRMPPGQQGRFKMGGALLAARTGTSVLLVAHNAGQFWPKRGFIKRPGVIRVVIGPFIESRGKTPQEINREAENWMQRTGLQLESAPP